MKNLFIKLFKITEADLPDSLESKIKSIILEQVDAKIRQIIKDEVILRLQDGKNESYKGIEDEIKGKLGKVFDKALEDTENITDKDFAREHPDLFAHP